MKRIISVLILLCIMLNFLILPTNAASRVDELLSNKSLEQKIQQMMMMSFQNWSSVGGYVTKMNPQIQQIMEDYDFGAVIYFANNIPSTKSAYQLTADMQAAATKNGGIPLLIATDQEGGTVYRLGTGTPLPGNMAIGATDDTSTAYTAGTVVGEELSVIGINTDLAPVVDVNNNANNPVIGLRSYGDDAEKVGLYASEFIRGLKETNTIGCAKHFPGHGDTSTDSHYGLPSVDKSYDELIENELKPYKVAISGGIDMIMTAHILYPQLEKDKIYSSKTGRSESLPATMSDDILTGILRNKLGFDGVICTDAMNMAGVVDYWKIVDASVIAINAGVDLLCMPVTISSISELNRIDSFINGIADAVKNGKISMDRIDDACRRILTLKEKRGILDYDPSDYSLDKALSVVGSDAHKEAERMISAKAVTVVKNNSVLPIAVHNNENILMLTPYDNERGLLAMGWNRAKEKGLIPDSAEVEIITFNTSDTSKYTSKLNAADKIIVISEISSASTVRNGKLAYSAPKAFVKYANDKGKPVIVMSVDKPYDVQLYPTADAVLAVYGCKGTSVDPTEALVSGTVTHNAVFGPNIVAGIEVIFGVFGASGKLPVDIPTLSFNSYKYTDELVYKNGFGLTYAPLTDPADEPDTDEPTESVEPTESASESEQISPIEQTDTTEPEEKDKDTQDSPKTSDKGFPVLLCVSGVLAAAALTAVIVLLVKRKRKIEA